MENFDFNSITFSSQEHKSNFIECCKLHQDTGRDLDCEVIALFYLIGLIEKVMADVKHRVYNFQRRAINPECLKDSWQTVSTLKALRLAYNLWSGYVENSGKAIYSTPHEIFDDYWAPYFVQAIKLRFRSSFDPNPNFCRTIYGTKRS